MNSEKANRINKILQKHLRSMLSDLERERYNNKLGWKFCFTCSWNATVAVVLLFILFFK